MSDYTNYGYDSLGLKTIAEVDKQYSAIEIDSLLENVSGKKLPDNSVSITSLQISISNASTVLAILPPFAFLTTAFDLVPSKQFTIFAIARFKIYVDVDNDPNYLLPYGASLSAGQQNNFVGTWTQDDVDYTLHTDNPRQREFINIQNFDSSSHTFYVHNGWRFFNII